MYPNLKKIVSTFFVIIFISQIINAQENLDSVNYYLLKIKNDKISLPVDSVLKYYQKARVFSNIHKKISLFRKESKYLTDIGMQNASYQSLVQALALAKKNNLPVAEVLINSAFSYYYYHFNKFSLSYEYLLLSKNQLERLTENQIKNYNIQNERKFTKQEMLQTTLSNIGTIALINDDIEKAEKHFEEALTFSISTKDKNAELDARINLASTLYNKKEYKKGIIAFKKLIDKYKLTKDDLSLAYYNISLNYNKLDSLRKANIYIDKAIKISQEIGDRVMLIDLFYLKSEIEHSLGQYAKERELLNKSLKDAISIDDTEGQLEFYKALAASEKASGNYQKANNWYNKLNTLQDSLNKERTKNLFNKIETENNLLIQEQKNELQIEVINNEKARAKLYMIIMILLVVLSIALFVTWLISKKDNYKRMKIEEQQARIKDIEIRNKRKIEVMETERIQEDLKAKKRELLVSLLFIKKRNEKLGKIHKEIDKIANQSIIGKEKLMSLKKFITKMSDELREEEDLQHKLVNTHKNFFNKLLAEYPELSKTELKILAYLRIGLSTKEIADVQYVSVDAIRKSRYRIRKKLNLDSKESLEKFILQFH